MTHRATPRFWACYHALPEEVRRLADRCYALLRENPPHPSLHFRPVGRLRSVRVGAHRRALGSRDGDVTGWVWIGSHAEYDSLITR